MEALRLEHEGPRNPPQVGLHQEPFGWRLLFHLIHPSVWALVAALWITVAALVLHEAAENVVPIERAKASSERSSSRRALFVPPLFLMQ